MRRLAALAALLLPLALTTPARAACTDPDSTGDLESRIAACQNELDQIYERSAQRHLVFNLARAYRLIDAPEMALSLLNEVISYDSGNALYWAELGRTLAALTLSRLDPSLVVERVDQLVSRLRRTRPGQERATLIGALVDAAFPQRGAELGRLTDIQLAAVRALVEADAWGDGPYVVSLLAAAGLPAEGPPRI